MLAARGYLSPNNKTEFNSFKQNTLAYGEDKGINEFKMEEVLDKYPELLFNTYPEYSGTEESTEEDDDFEIGDDNE